MGAGLIAQQRLGLAGGAVVAPQTALPVVAGVFRTGQPNVYGLCLTVLGAVTLTPLMLRARSSARPPAARSTRLPTRGSGLASVGRVLRRSGPRLHKR